MDQAIIDNIVKECIAKWGRDSRTERFEELVNLWLDKVHDGDKNIYLKLLKNFRYYSKKNENDYASFIINNIIKVDKDIEETIVIPLLKPEEGMSGAYKILRSIQVVGGLRAEVCPINLLNFEQKYDIDLIKNIIIVDDISGTGRTLEKSLKYMKESYPSFFHNKMVYVSCLVISEVAKSHIQLIKDIHFWQYDITKKAFDNGHIFSENEVESTKDKIKIYEKMLSTQKDESDIFGFENSELLIAFSDDTPNNTLLSFWKENNGWKPIFPRARRRQKPGWAKSNKTNIKLNISMMQN
ncbi:phosphoribosyltransferase-like protein [Desnuesiella massiliensis]|uniref:phosphoribosyltransferase-like protein n=1 Tax=Desnuesiella massiliensis TaxID=1650662 RepID=UPI0006E2169B|nr:hypothetical protein [Desnuesiella massiliensis]